MFKKQKILMIPAVAYILLLSGCGETDTTCKIDVQRAIDTGDFQTAISKLNGECAGAFSANDKLYNLATAYMGEAGYSVSEIVKMALVASDSNNAFSSFVRKVAQNRNESSLELIKKAKKAYLLSIDPNSDETTLFTQYCKNGNFVDSPRVSNACFYVGYNQIMLTSVSVSYLTENIDETLNAIDSSGSVPDDMKASVDALAWASGQPTPYPNNSTVTDSNVTINGISYKHLSVDLNNSGKIFYRLADSAAPSATSSTVVTDGYCTASGDKTACSGIENTDGSINTAAASAASCYACPVVIDGSALTVTESLVDAINDGVDSIVSITSDPDIQQSVEEFKNDITNNAGADVTVTDIINYLNAN